ncbi:MAG: hypothetical protein JXB45_00400 [Candidatus Krumholzibacteriota bacterium]|nr:hypothetical protein [Candidatus Krumholzibacteriota bacterium]
MKKVLMLLVVLALFGGAAHAGYPYVAVYGDADRLVTENCAIGASFVVWVWHYPNAQGMMSAEFAMTYPPGCYNIGKTPNPDYTLVMDDPTSATGGAITFANCSNDWKWSYQITVLPTGIEPGWIEVIPHPATGKIQQAECTAGFPLYEVIFYHRFGHCTDGEVDAEDASWGAIKGMYSE